MTGSGLAKFFLGIFTGIALLGLIGFALGYYFLTKTSVLPPKPTFAEERSRTKSPQKPSANQKSSSNLLKKSTSASQPKPSPTSSP